MIEHVNDVQVLRPARAMLLTVREGRIWLTRSGDADDHVLGAGESLVVAAGQRLVVEPWRASEPARLDWKPLQVPVALPALRAAVAGSARRAAAGLLVLARRVDVPPAAERCLAG